ncbi:MAG: DUF4366 domain-containing protein [Lachnospiraceae bacterium]|nr:DUF4366 domain-containing protein [Lachnospiraceae bacterium]
MVKDYLITQLNNIKRRAKDFELNEKLDEIKDMLADKGLYPKREEEKKKVNPVVIVLAVIGAIAAVAAIAYAVFYFFMPEDSEYFEDFDEDNDDEFEDSDFEDD